MKGGSEKQGGRSHARRTCWETSISPNPAHLADSVQVKLTPVLSLPLNWKVAVASAVEAAGEVWVKVTVAGGSSGDHH